MMATHRTLTRRSVLYGGLLWWASGCSGARTETVAYRTAVGGADNQVTVLVEDEVVWIDVISPQGIGSAFVYLPVTEPLPLRFRLHLSGLELFRLWWAGQTVTASLAAADASAVQVWGSTLSQPEKPITPESPEWPEISYSADGASIVVIPPAAWKSSQPRLFGIAWIDFYR